MTELNEHRNNPLLTEFDFIPWFQRCWTYERLLGLALFWSLLATTPLILGGLAGTNCFWVSIRLEDPSGPTVAIPFGFVAELNHGLFYLFGMLLFIGSAIFFLERAGLAIRNLSDSGQLILSEQESLAAEGSRVVHPTETVKLIENANRRFFTGALWILPPALLALLLGTELPTIHQKKFGWVQSSNVLEYENAKLSDFTITSLPRVKTAFKLEKNAWVTKEGEYLIAKVIRPPFSQEDSRRAWQQSNKTWFRWFLPSALFVEWLSHIIIGWIAFKILFLVWILVSANWIDRDESNAGSREHVAYQSVLRRWLRRPVRFSLTVDFYDSNCRLGIGHLDPVYNSALFLGLLGAAVYWVGQISNVNKGTSWVWGNPTPFHIGQVIIPVVVLLVVGGICGYPFWHLVRSVARRKTEKIHELVAVKHLRADDAKVKQIECQSLWPGWKTLYVSLASICFILAVLLPLGLSSVANILPGSKVADVIAKTAESLPSAICSSEVSEH